MVMMKDLRGLRGRNQSMTEEPTELKTSLELTLDQLENNRLAKRHADRQAVRQTMARQAADMRRYQDNLSAIEGCRMKADEIADNHVARCQPIQDELTAISEIQDQEIIEDRAADPALESRRRELLQQLDVFNEELEREIDASQRELDRLKMERPALAAKIPITADKATRLDLYQLGRADLVAQHQLAELRHKHACELLAALQNPLLDTSAKELEAAEREVELTKQEMTARFDDVVKE